MRRVEYSETELQTEYLRISAIWGNSRSGPWANISGTNVDRLRNRNVITLFNVDAEAITANSDAIGPRHPLVCIDPERGYPPF